MRARQHLLAQRGEQPRNRLLDEVVCFQCPFACGDETITEIELTLLMPAFRFRRRALARIDSGHAWFLKRQGVVPTR